MNLRLHRLAVAEIDHEVDYYEARQPGLGSELEDDVDAVLELILRFPQAAPQWKDRADRRVAVLDRFPFTIPYQIVGDETSSSLSPTQVEGRDTGHGVAEPSHTRRRDRDSLIDRQRRA